MAEPGDGQEPGGRERELDERERQLRDRELDQRERELDVRERELAAAEAEREQEIDSARMPFLEHLRELRLRLRNASVAIAAGFVLALAFSRELYVLLARPLVRVLSELAVEDPELYSQALYFNSIIEPITTYLAIAFWGGLFLASPFIFHQIWKFIAPGLYVKERRYGVAFAIASAFFFLGGASFCYFVVLEPVHEFLLAFSSHNMGEMSRPFGMDYDVGEGAIALKPLLTMKEYLSFAKKLILGFGLIFELPLLIFFLSAAGVVTHRQLWKFNRWAAVIAVLLAAALTPPDIYSQVLMAGPIIVLYNFSIVIAYLVTARREKREAAPADAG